MSFEPCSRLHLVGQNLIVVVVVNLIPYFLCIMSLREKIKLYYFTFVFFPFWLVGFVSGPICMM